MYSKYNHYRNYPPDILMFYGLYPDSLFLFSYYLKISKITNPGLFSGGTKVRQMKPDKAIDGYVDKH